LRPLIGITCGQSGENNFAVNKNYVRAVEEAGGIPLVLPVTGIKDLWPSTCGKKEGEARKSYWDAGGMETVKVNKKSRASGGRQITGAVGQGETGKAGVCLQLKTATPTVSERDRREAGRLGEEGIIERLVREIDGLLLSGGGDPDPFFFGEEPLPGTGVIDPERDLFEIALASAALATDLPVLGICRGMQLLNIAAGGSIWQDIRTASPAGLWSEDASKKREANNFRIRLKHFQEAPRWYPTHRIYIVTGSRLAEILNAASARVNSFHHQAVKEVAPGFGVTARSADGIIEGIESKRHRFAVGVQFHPEHLRHKYRCFDLIFKVFVEMAKG